MNRYWNNQKPNPSLKTKMGNKLKYQICITLHRFSYPDASCRRADQRYRTTGDPTQRLLWNCL